MDSNRYLFYLKKMYGSVFYVLRNWHNALFLWCSDPVCLLSSIRTCYVLYACLLVTVVDVLRRSVHVLHGWYFLAL